MDGFSQTSSGVDLSQVLGSAASAVLMVNIALLLFASQSSTVRRLLATCFLDLLFAANRFLLRVGSVNKLTWLAIALCLIALFKGGKAHAGTDIWTALGGACPSGGPSYSAGTGATGAAAHTSAISNYNSTCYPTWECYTYAVTSTAAQSGTGTASGSVSAGYTGTKTNSSSACTPYPATQTSSGVASISCSAGKVLNAQGACITGGSCPAYGTNYSAGYYDMGTSSTAPFPAYVCAPSSCGLVFSGSVPKGTSMVAGVLHYYAFGSYDYVGGTPDPACTLTPATAAGSVPAATCGAGQQKGTVNGQVVCLNTSTGSTTPQTTQTTSSSSTPTTTNPDGSTTKTSTVTNPDGSKATTVTVTQTSGATSSTTTITQSPTGGGLPPMSPIGSSAGNPSNKSDQNPTCGWPGGPACKIDETGTPSDGSLADQKSSFDSAATARNNAISALGSQGDHGLVWDWTWVLPSGTCTAMNYGVPGKMISLDPCEKLGMVRDLLGFALYIVTALGLLGVIANSQNKG